MGFLRVRPQRGRFIVLIGPDGVGKTSVAKAIVSIDASIHYFHFRPELSDPWTRPTPGETLDKPVVTSGAAISVIRLGMAAVRFWVAYLVHIRPTLVQGRDVVGDRWAYGYVARPRELRYDGPIGLARKVVSALPQPDLVACLVAPPDIIVQRKAELTVSEIANDLQAWSDVPARRVVQLSTVDSPRQVGKRILDLARENSPT